MTAPVPVARVGSCSRWSNPGLESLRRRRMSDDGHFRSVRGGLSNRTPRSNGAEVRCRHARCAPEFKTVGLSIGSEIAIVGWRRAEGRSGPCRFVRRGVLQQSVLAGMDVNDYVEYIAFDEPEGT